MSSTPDHRASTHTACVCECHLDNRHCTHCCDSIDALCEDCAYYRHLELAGAGR